MRGWQGLDYVHQGIGETGMEARGDQRRRNDIEIIEQSPP